MIEATVVIFGTTMRDVKAHAADASDAMQEQGWLPDTHFAKAEAKMSDGTRRIILRFHREPRIRAS